MPRVARVFTGLGRWLVPQIPAEPNESPRVFAHRRYREFFTNTFRAVVWLALWGGAGIAPTILFTQGHKVGAQVGVGLAVYLVCTSLGLGIPYGASRLTAPSTLLHRERLERVGERQGHTLALRELNRRNEENVQSWREAFERKSEEAERLRGLLGEAAAKLRAGPAAAKSDLEVLGEATARNTKDVLRADLVYLGDELAAARRTLVTAYNDSRYWHQEINATVWENVKNKHLAAPHFHGPRSLIAEAYVAIQEAENLRLMYDAEVAGDLGTPLRMHDADREELRGILDRLVSGENALTQYLDALDMPS